MTADDTARLRELAESVIHAAEQRQQAADDPAIDWTEYDRIAQEAVDQQEALVERVGARTLLALIDRLEAAERERAFLHKAATRAVIALAHASERDKAYARDYTELSEAIEAHRAAIDALAAKEQSNG